MAKKLQDQPTGGSDRGFRRRNNDLAPLGIANVANIACQERLPMPFYALLPVRLRRAIVVVLAALAGFGTLTPAMAASDPSPPAGCAGPASKTWLRVIVEGVHSAGGEIA